MIKKERIYNKYFSVPNLKLAWERMIRSNGKDSKPLKFRLKSMQNQKSLFE